MTAPVAAGPHFEFDVFNVAVGATVVFGALSTLLPPMVAPTATLAALAFAGWVSRARRRGPFPHVGLSRGSAAALGVLAGATAGFLECPTVLEPVRGIFLAGGLMPLFVTERLRSSPRPPGCSEP